VNYNQIVQSFMKLQASYRMSRGEVETQFIKDKHKEAMHYLLVNVGFIDDYRVYGAFIHIDVKNDGKVWIQHDGTDLPVADYLMEMGIAREDIGSVFTPKNCANTPILRLPDEKNSRKGAKTQSFYLIHNSRR